MKERIPFGVKCRPLLVAALLLILIFAVVYAAAVGPYWKITPDSSSYVLGAKSLARGEGYTVRGNPVQLFPPLTSMIFSVFHRLSPDNYRLLNGVVTLFALASLFLFWRLFRDSLGNVAGLVIVLLSMGSVYLFQQSTFLLSDIFYMFFSAASLLAFENLMGGKSRFWVFPAGGALLGACLTRSAGIALLAAVIVAMLVFLAGKRTRGAEAGGSASALWLALAFVLPLLFTVLWGVRNARQGLSYFDLFFQKEAYVPEAGYATLLDLLCRFFSNLKRFLGIGEVLSNAPSDGLPVIQAVARFIGTGLFFWGLFRSLKKELTLTALYATLYLLLIEMNQAETGFRLLVPLVPICFFYAWRGLADIGSRLRLGAETPAGKAAAVCLVGYVLLYLGVGMSDMLHRLPREHQSPFGAYPVKYEANYDAQRLALWLRANSPAQTRYLCQHARMWDVVTERRGFDFPFSRDPRKLMNTLVGENIDYVLVDKNKEMVGAFLMPVLQAFPSKFELVIEAERASLYRIKK